MRPVQVSGLVDFNRVFGNPMPGKGKPDAWREGNYSSATHGVYAAHAYFQHGGPVTFVKLAGYDHIDKTSTATRSGWRIPAPVANFGLSVTPGTTDAVASSAPGAFGLYVAASSSTNLNFIHAATFYVERGAITLHGDTTADGTAMLAAKSGVNVAVKSLANNAFKIRFYDDSVNGVGGTSDAVTGSDAIPTNGLAPDGKVSDYTVSFKETNSNFIRSVFQSSKEINPTSTNTSITSNSSLKDFWLGESYEQSVREHLGSTVFAAAGAGELYGIMVPLFQKTTSVDFGDHRRDHTSPKTGWVFSQNTKGSASLDTSAPGVLSGSTDIRSSVQELFRFHSLYGGEYEQKNFKISISNIKKSQTPHNKYGTFDVVVRMAGDKDSSPQVEENFSGCNLDPGSPKYIAAMIGDKTTEWDSADRRYKEYGDYPNISSIIRVEMNEQIGRDGGPELSPFGFYGPLKFATATSDSHTAFTGTSIVNPAKAAIPYSSSFSGWVMGDVGQHTSSATASFAEPSLRLRQNAEGFNDSSMAYFGLSTQRSGSMDIHDDSFSDVIRAFPGGVDISARPSAATGTVYSFIFTLDDVRLSGSNNTAATYAAGNHASGVAYTATSPNTYDSLLDLNFNKFTMPLVGGFDGVDIRERNPFRNTVLGSSETVDYAYNSIKRAIDLVSDPEVVECNLMTVPGIYKSSLTTHLINTCEARADALAIIDLEGDFKDKSENAEIDSHTDRKANVTTTVNNLTTRALNSSYGATYFPWCKLVNREGTPIPVPPSVIAMGVLSYSQRFSELWFAPAGFTRGGLSNVFGQSSGLTVAETKYPLNSKERDKLYDANINPIATFPNEGIVVFGQKTLQVTQSALDRINVRRLMIYLKKEISRMSATLLFDQNVRSTWNRFLGQVEPFLLSVKSRFGLTEFRVILDETTTTPELIDRNIMYAKIFLKPARAIEFIALDFIITDSGASFDDL